MGYRSVIGVVIALNFWFVGFAKASDVASDSIVTKPLQVVQPFLLKSVSGEFIGMSTFPEAKGMIVVFTCNHCPFAKLYPERMNELHRKYAPKGIPLLAISSTDTVLFEDAVKSLLKHKKVKVVSTSSIGCFIHIRSN
jgi:IS30 family transposase